MSGPGSPPETGTLSASDDRYNNFAQAPDAAAAQPDPTAAPQQQPGLFSPQPMTQQGAPMQGAGAPQPELMSPQPLSQQSNAQLAQALNLAMTQEGKEENVNKADIQQYLKTGGVGMDPTKAAWCAAFVNSSLKQAGLPGSGSQVATSFLNYGEKADTPQPGDIMVQPRGRAAGQVGGHVGFATGQTREGANGPEYEMFSGNKGNRAVRTWEPASSVQIRRVAGQAAQEQAAAAPAAPATPQFGDPNFSRQPIAPELQFGDPGYALEPDMPGFSKVPIRYKGKIAPIANMQNPISLELDGLASQDQPPLEGMDFQVPMPPKSAIPSQMFDPQTTFTRAKGQYTPMPAAEPNMTRAQSFPMFESNYDMSNPPPAYETPVSDIPPEERTFMQKLDQATRAVRQLGRGTMNAASGMTYGTAQGLAALQTLPSRIIGYEDPFHEAGYNFWKGRAEAAQRGAADITGLGGQGAAPQNAVEKLALTTGESIMPMGKFTVPLTAGIVAFREGMDVANAAPKRLENFAGMLSAGNIDVSAPTQPINVVMVPQDDGTVVVAPSSSIYGKVNLPPDKAIEQYNRVGAFYGHFQNEGDAKLFVDAINDRVHMPVMTAGGPSKVSMNELALMGMTGAASIGLALAPGVVSAMMARSTPKLGRTVADAAPGTEAFSNRGDYLASTVYDINRGPMRIAGRYITDPLALRDINDAFTLQTRGAASNIADSAVRNGVSMGPNFTFQVKKPLAELQEASSPTIEQYLNLRDTFDDINAVDRMRANLPAKAQAKLAAAGPITVRGLTEQDVLSQMSALEKADPTVRQVAPLYYDNLKAYRSFLGSNSEYSLISRKELKRMNAENPNEVPFIGDQRVWEDPNYVRQSPFVALGETMRTGMRLQMENTAKGMYVDAMRQAEPSSFQRVTSQQLRDNPHWERNTIKIYRRGKPEYYTTDPFVADVLKMDPYYFQNKAVNALYKTKLAVEHYTTGMFAPWFANTSLLRNHQIIKPTVATMPGIQAPNFIQSLMGIPRQLGPQLAHYGAGPNVVKTIYSALDRGSAGWLSKTFGPNFVQSLSARLQTIHNDSLFARLEAAGSHRGSILEHQIQTPTRRHWARLTQTNNAILDRAINGTTGAARTFLNGWKNTFGAVHNAPSYALARRNEGRMTMPQLAGMARQATGDPMSGGQLTNKGKVLRFHDENLWDTAKTRAAQGVGGLAEFSRVAVPWFNPSLQGMRRLGQAYLENPKRFVANAWMFTALPAATASAWNMSLGKDPQGQSYFDYHINGRSQYNTMMNYYIGIPGRPVSEGIQIPRFHELAPLARMMEIAMDHAFRSNIFTNAEDFKNVAANGVKVIFEPSTPPLFNVAFAGAGMVGPQGAFGGDAYKRKDQPFDQNAGLPANVELYMRAVAPGLADVLGAGISAAIQAEEGKSRVGAFAQEAAKRAISKDPIWRAVTNIQPPATGNTRITEELFAKQKAISDLDTFYKNWGLTGGPLELKGRIPGARSQAGNQIVKDALGNPLPRGAPGLGQPEPTNPLYVMFAKELHDKFKKDDPKNGGIGFQSMWKRYTEASTAIQTTQKIGAGNFVTWQRYLDTVPDTKQFLMDAGVDYKNPTAVRSFYESYRQAAAKQILFTIRAVEQEFSQRLGQPIKLEQLEPYGKGIKEKEPDYDLTEFFDQANPP